jgi:hypothetical protein
MTNLTRRLTRLLITCGTAADENCSRYEYSCSCQRKGPRAGQGTSSARRRITGSRATSVTIPLTGIGASVFLRARLTDDEIVEYLSYLRAKDVSEIVFPGPAPRVVPADPDDDPVVHTAVVGRADALCTLNRDLFTPLVRDYCRERGVLIANDVELLGLLRSQEPKR